MTGFYSYVNIPNTLSQSLGVFCVKSFCRLGNSLFLQITAEFRRCNKRVLKCSQISNIICNKIELVAGLGVRARAGAYLEHRSNSSKFTKDPIIKLNREMWHTSHICIQY